MKTIFISLMFRWMTIENISTVAAKCIVWLLEYCRNKGDKYWDIAKNIIKKINNWCSLFLEVYEDDTLTPDEEAKIAEAISKQTDVQTIVKILQSQKQKLENRSVRRGPKNRKRRNAKNERRAVRQLSVRLEDAERHQDNI